MVSWIWVLGIQKPRSTLVGKIPSCPPISILPLLFTNVLPFLHFKAGHRFYLEQSFLCILVCLSIYLSSGQRNVPVCNICEVSLKGEGVPFSFHFIFPAEWETAIIAGAGMSILGHEVTLGMLTTHSGTKREDIWDRGTLYHLPPDFYRKEK